MATVHERGGGQRSIPASVELLLPAENSSSSSELQQRRRRSDSSSSRRDEIVALRRGAHVKLCDDVDGAEQGDA